MRAAAPRWRRALLCIADEALSRFLSHELENAEFLVADARGLTRLRVAIEHRVPEIVILHVNRFGSETTESIRELRALAVIPLLVISTVRLSDADLADLFEAGADDVVLTPLGRREFIARVDALLRRFSGTVGAGQAELPLGPMVLDLRTKSVSANGRKARLSPTEFKLLVALAQTPGAVLSYDDLFERVWGSRYHGSQEALRTNVRRLRRRLEMVTDDHELVSAANGYGYYLAAEAKP